MSVTIQTSIVILLLLQIDFGCLVALKLSVFHYSQVLAVGVA